jgi:hypothetical protein
LRAGDQVHAVRQLSVPTGLRVVISGRVRAASSAADQGAGLRALVHVQAAASTSGLDEL